MDALQVETVTQNKEKILCLPSELTQGAGFNFFYYGWV